MLTIGFCKFRNESASHTGNSTFIPIVKFADWDEVSKKPKKNRSVPSLAIYF